MQTDLNWMYAERLEDKATAHTGPDESLGGESFQDSEKVNFHTGLPSHSVLMTVLDLISPGLVLRYSLIKLHHC